MRHFTGYKNEDRLLEAMEGSIVTLTGTIPVKAYRKKTLTYAAQLDEPFSVDTLEGLHTGKAGDWLAVGAHGELYPIDQQVFADTYEEVDV